MYVTMHTATSVAAAAGRASCRHCMPSKGKMLLGRHFRSSAIVRSGFSGIAVPSQPLAGARSAWSFQARAESSNGASAPAADGAREYDYDLFTIGAGSGGTRASRVSASLYGAKVGIAEMPFGAIASDSVGGAGGTCVLRGCVPKKLFVYAASYRDEFRESRGFGYGTQDDIPLDWTSFMVKKRAELTRLHDVYNTMLKKSGCDMFEGRATVVDPHTVEVAGKRYTAKHILLAMGGRAVSIPIEGAEHSIISDDILELNEIPKKLIIIGSGYIGLEFACIFGNLGTEVHVMFRGEKPLTGFDDEVRTHANEQYELRGLHMHNQVTPERIVKNADGTVTLYARNKDGEEVVQTGDHVLMATGRKPNTKNMGLEENGVELDPKSGAIKVDEYSRSTCPSIWAVGDVTDRMNLTPVALMEGMALVHHIFGNDPDSKPTTENIASAVFTTPQIATIGYTEESAREKFPNLNIFTSTFRPMKATISGNPGKSLMKIIVDADSDRVLGMHMVGADGPEIFQGMAVAIKLGVTKRQLDSVVGIHPTAAEELVTMREATRQIRNRELVTA